MSKTKTTKTETVIAETTVEKLPRKPASIMGRLRDMHWDKRKGKIGWHYIIPTVIAVLGVLSVLQYQVVTIIVCFSPDLFTPTTIQLLEHSYDKSWEFFGVSGATYIGGAVANIFTKGGDVLTSSTIESETQRGD